MSNHIIILAAGESRRFKEAGYTKPKGSLILKNPDGVTSSMIGHVQQSILELMPFENIITVLRKGYETPIDIVGNVTFVKQTSGQADTLHQIIRQLPDNDSAMVFDCDMILRSVDIFAMSTYLKLYDIVIAVTKTFDPNASRVDKVPFPEHFAEKEPISEWGIVGLRAFHKIGMLYEALFTTLKDCQNKGVEPYLSMALNHYPCYKGMKFALEIKEYVDLGTPERIKEAGWEIINN